MDPGPSRAGRRRRSAWLATFVCVIVGGVLLRMLVVDPGTSGDGLAPDPATQDESSDVELATPGTASRRTRSATPRDPARGLEEVEGGLHVPPPGDARLVVRVLDAAERPVEGASIEWVVMHPTYGTSEKMSAGRTDAGGFVAPPDAATWLGLRFGGRDERGPGGWMISRLGLRCTLPFDEYEPRDGLDPPSVHWLDEEPSEGAVIDLVLPPSGAVQFEWDAILRDGSPVLDGYFLHIRRADGEHFPRWRDGFTVPAGATRHDHAPVGLGWEVYGSLSHPGVLGTLGTVTAPGPTRAGESIVLRIERSEAQARLVSLCGTAITSEGTPVSEARLRVWLADPEASGTRRQRVLTDDGGAWSFLVSYEALRQASTSASATREIHLTTTIEGEEWRGAATLDLSDESLERFDLGPVALQPSADDETPAALIAAGRVIDTAGEPVSGAHVGASARARSLDGAPVEDPNAWIDLGWGRTDPEGRYELRAVVELADPALRLRASHADYEAVDPREVAAGRSDVDFVLTRGLAVELSVLVEPWAAMAEVVTLRFSGEGTSRKPSLLDFVGHYDSHFGGLRPGRYSLQIRLHGGDWVLHEQELDVGQDMDLGPIDVRGKLATCHLELLDAHGAPLTERYVRVVDRVSRTTIDRSVRVGDGGRAVLIVPRALRSVTIAASGGATAEVPSSAFSLPEAARVPEPLQVTLAPR